MTVTLLTPRTIRRPGPPSIDDVTRRDLLRGASAALLLGAAGCDEPGGEAAAPTAAPGVRRIEHALGAADVPARLKRVVVIDSFTTLHTALLLDVPVVGATTFDGAEPFASFLPSEETEGIASVGYLELDLEAIAALEPDLIVGSEQFMAEPYDRLAQIAPAVAIDYIPQVDWKDHERLLGEVLGQRAAVDVRVAAYERRVGELQAALGDRLDELEVTFLRLVEDEIRVHTRCHFAGAVLHEVGVRRPTAQGTDDPEENILTWSAERIGDLDADVILYAVSGGGFDPDAAAQALARYEGNPLWQGLEAVQQGGVHAVDPTYWLSGGVRAAELILDDLGRLG